MAWLSFSGSSEGAAVCDVSLKVVGAVVFSVFLFVKCCAVMSVAQRHINTVIIIIIFLFIPI